MKKWTHVPLALAMVTALACGGNNNNNDTNAGRTGGDAGTVGTTGAMNNNDAGIDRGFVEMMAADSTAEVELGRLAQERASHPQVKEFGQMMVRDHQAAGEQLQQIVSKHNITPGGGDHGDHNDLRERLSGLSGAEFDREYINAMVTNHQRVVDELTDQVEDSQNAEVKQWAAATLPKVTQHLERARSIQQTLNQNENRTGNERNNSGTRKQ